MISGENVKKKPLKFVLTLKKMSHYVEAFPVSAKLKEKLKRRGFSCVDDFLGLKVKDLVEEVGGIKSEDAAWLLDHCQQIKGSYIKDFSLR